MESPRYPKLGRQTTLFPGLGNSSGGLCYIVTMLDIVFHLFELFPSLDFDLVPDSKLFGFPF
jgi:hypothetical protein